MQLLVFEPGRRYELAELTAGLRDPSPLRRPGSQTGRVGAGELDRRLLAIPAADYVHALTGRRANRAGKVCCPFHDPDRTPSLQLYADGSWYCYGACRTGGTIYDFAARLWRTGTHGHEFVELRKRLTAQLLPQASFPFDA